MSIKIKPVNMTQLVDGFGLQNPIPKKEKEPIYDEDDIFGPMLDTEIEKLKKKGKMTL